MLSRLNNNIVLKLNKKFDFYYFFKNELFFSNFFKILIDKKLINLKLKYNCSYKVLKFYICKKILRRFGLVKALKVKKYY